MTEKSTENSEIPLSGILKITLAYGFVGFAAVILLYIFTMLFWSVSMLNAAHFIGLVQTYLLVLFVQFSTGFFTQIAIYKKYNTDFPDTGREPGSDRGKFRNYGLLGGLFTGIFILLFPAATAPLMYHNNSMWINTFTNIFNNFFPFVITGIIGGVAGSYCAVSLLNKGFIGRDDYGKAIREIFLCLALAALLIVFVPASFALATTHPHEPAVIGYGEYNHNNLIVIKTDPDGNIIWTADPIKTTTTQPGLVIEMKNGSYALFGHELSAHGGTNTLTYISEGGNVSGTIPFLRGEGLYGYPVEIPGTGFWVPDFGRIYCLGYDGNISGIYSLPEELDGDAKMVYAYDEGVFLQLGRYSALMDLKGNFSAFKSYREYGTSDRLYRMTTEGVSDSFNGGYLICVADEDTRELKAVWLDRDLDPVKEETIGSIYSSPISVYRGDDGDVIITRDISPADNPSNSESYFRIYNSGQDSAYNIMPGDDCYYSEVFEAENGYTLFTVRDRFLSDGKEVVMKRYAFDGTCSGSKNILTGMFTAVKIMQTSDGGYLLEYLTGEDD